GRGRGTGRSIRSQRSRIRAVVTCTGHPTDGRASGAIVRPRRGKFLWRNRGRVPKMPNRPRIDSRRPDHAPARERISPMLSTLVLTAALSLTPAQNDGLTLSNARTTLGGILGPRRANNDYLPGDVCYMAFDIENLKLAADGTAEYAIGMEVTDA